MYFDVLLSLFDNIQSYLHVGARYCENQLQVLVLGKPHRTAAALRTLPYIQSASHNTKLRSQIIAPVNNNLRAVLPPVWLPCSAESKR